jgi:chromosome segregation ATPase
LIEADFGTIKAKSDHIKMELVAKSEELKRLESYSIEDHNRFEAERFEKLLLSRNEKVASLQSELKQVREEAESLRVEKVGLNETISWELVEKEEVNTKIRDLQIQISQLTEQTLHLSNLYELGRTKMIADGFTVEKDANDRQGYEDKLQQYKDSLDEEEAFMRKAFTQGCDRLKATLQKRLSQTEETETVLQDMILRKKRVLHEVKEEISDGGTKLNTTLYGLVQE